LPGEPIALNNVSRETINQLTAYFTWQLAQPMLQTQYPLISLFNGYYVKIAQSGMTVMAFTLRQTVKIMWHVNRFLFPIKPARWRPAYCDLTVHLVEEIIIAF
jgi:hypothetical protein